MADSNNVQVNNKQKGAEVVMKIRVGNRMANLRVALELYSVRDDLAKDVRGTLKAVAAMGYEGVEFAGFPLPGKELRMTSSRRRLPSTAPSATAASSFPACRIPAPVRARTG